MDINESVIKGGVCWLDFAVTRGPKGLEIYIKMDPRLAAFIKSLGSGAKGNTEEYGRSWHSLTPGKSLEVYGMEQHVSSPTYTLDAVAEGFKSRDGLVNLSFLRIVGVDEPQGMRFGVSGPFSKSYIREAMGDAIRETRNLIRDYVVPVQINLRISSQEV